MIFWTGVWVEMSRPIGAYQLAHWLRKNGYDVQVIDFTHSLTQNELFDITDLFITDKTLCIGISSTFWASFEDGRFRSVSQIPENLKNAMSMIKSRHPKIKFVLGGSQVDHLEKNTIELFDFVVSGTGEDTLLEFLEGLRKNRKSVFSLETKFGVPYKTGSLNNRFNIHENDHIFIDQDCIIEGETLPIEISRGCIFKCSYCQYPFIGKKKLDYIRNIDLIKSELEHNYKKFKVKNYFLMDDTFNDTPTKMNLWFDCLKSLNFNIEYTGYMRADLLSRNEDQIEKFKESGLASVFFGIETFHPNASKIIGKGWSGKEGKQFLSRLKSIWLNDVTIHLSFIVGFEEETMQDYIETQNWCIENKIDSWIWQPLYINRKNRLFSSEIDRNPKKFGFKFDKSGNWHNSTHSQESAFQLSLNLIKNSNKHNIQKITSWKMLYMMSMGYDSNFLKNNFIKDINFYNLRLKEIEFLQKYIKKLKSITV